MLSAAQAPEVKDAQARNRAVIHRLAEIYSFRVERGKLTVAPADVEDNLARMRRLGLADSPRVTFRCSSRLRSDLRPGRPADHRRSSPRRATPPGPP